MDNGPNLRCKAVLAIGVHTLDFLLLHDHLCRGLGLKVEGSGFQVRGLDTSADGADQGLGFLADSVLQQSTAGQKS